LETDSISWSRGTVMIVTLQIENDSTNGDQPYSIAVQSEVVRTSSKGMGLRFCVDGVKDRRAILRFLNTWQGAARASHCRGQSLAEFALIFPLMFLLVVNVVNFGSFMYAWITVANAARAGSEYWITGTATVLAPNAPTASQVTAVITKDINALPNRASLTVEVCTNNKSSGTAVVTCSGTYGTLTPPVDPEPGSFVSASVDVKYVYQPPIPLWDVPGLNIHATLPSTTIHRQAVMRLMN